MSHGTFAQALRTCHRNAKSLVTSWRQKSQPLRTVGALVALLPLVFSASSVQAAAPEGAKKATQVFFSSFKGAQKNIQEANVLAQSSVWFPELHSTFYGTDYARLLRQFNKPLTFSLNNEQDKFYISSDLFRSLGGINNVIEAKSSASAQRAYAELVSIRLFNLLRYVEFVKYLNDEGFWDADVQFPELSAYYNSVGEFRLVDFVNDAVDYCDTTYTGQSGVNANQILKYYGDHVNDPANSEQANAFYWLYSTDTYALSACSHLPLIQYYVTDTSYRPVLNYLKKLTSNWEDRRSMLARIFPDKPASEFDGNNGVERAVASTANKSTKVSFASKGAERVTASSKKKHQVASVAVVVEGMSNTDSSLDQPQSTQLAQAQTQAPAKKRSVKFASFLPKQVNAEKLPAKEVAQADALPDADLPKTQPNRPSGTRAGIAFAAAKPKKTEQANQAQQANPNTGVFSESAQRVDVAQLLAQQKKPLIPANAFYDAVLNIYSYSEHAISNANSWDAFQALFTQYYKSATRKRDFVALVESGRAKNLLNAEKTLAGQELIEDLVKGFVSVSKHESTSK